MAWRMYALYRVPSSYGCVLWRISSNVVQTFYTTWGNCVRTVWKVLWRTHCDLVK